MNIKFLLFCLLSFWVISSLDAQVKSTIQNPTSINDNGTLPDNSAILDIQSINKGVLVPRMTTIQREAISNPADGLLVFDQTTGGFWFFFGGAWQDLSIGKPGTLVIDGDGDTKVDVEENADEDIIRFDVNGTEVGRMDGQTFHLEAPGQSLFIGENAGVNDDGTSNSNTFVGQAAGEANTSGFSNTFIGGAAGEANTTGSLNTFIGHDAGESNTTGELNTFMGRDAGEANTTGVSNTFLGEATGASNTTGEYNTFLGQFAAFGNTTGSNNTVVGQASGNSMETGSGNTLIGYNADMSLADLTNASSFGQNATVSVSNKVRIGDTNISVIEGQVDWSFPSDGRFKNNIQENVKGLDFITKLRPVTYQFDVAKFSAHVAPDRKDDAEETTPSPEQIASTAAASEIIHTGFIAQEVEAAARAAGFADFGGVLAPTHEKDNYGLRYGTFVVPLVKAVQEQQELIDSQNASIESLKAENAALKARMDKLEVFLKQENK